MNRRFGALGDAVGFLTILGRGGAPTAATLGWFPVVGAGLGALVGLAWWGAAEIWPPLVVGVIVVAVDLVLTGALHHDGLADSADGVLPHLERERRLEVMRTPDVGAFAAVVLVTVVGARIAAFASISPEPLAIAGLWCASRTAMALTARTVPYARATGLASSFLGGGGRGAVAVGVLGVVLTTALIAPVGLPGAAAVGALVVTSIAVVALARRRLGGFTGDVLGAIGVLGETAALLTLAANW